MGYAQMSAIERPRMKGAAMNNLLLAAADALESGDREERRELAGKLRAMSSYLLILEARKPKGKTMNCDQCVGCKWQLDQSDGPRDNWVSVRLPCGLSQDDLRLEVSCMSREQKTTPIDPAATQESTCGECATYSVLHAVCEETRYVREPKHVACVLFKAKDQPDA